MSAWDWLTEVPTPAPPQRAIDFDLETLNAGYTDPNWTPDKIIACAWSWAGEEHIHVTCDLDGFFDREKRRELLRPLLAAFDSLGPRDVVRGHNITRFDLPSLNAECMRLNLPPLKPMLVEDTMKILRAKGFKKGQDNIGALVQTPVKKLSLNWQEWDDAYSEGAPWQTVRDRVASDVLQHKLMREEMSRRGWLKAPRMWRP